MRRRTTTFLWHYLRGYAGWAMLAAAGILVYAAATHGTAALIKPIFGEVLLAGDDMPSPFGAISTSRRGRKGRVEEGHGGDPRRPQEAATSRSSSTTATNR